MHCKIIAIRTGKVLLTDTYAACVEYLRIHWDNFEAGDIEIVYASNGRCASFKL